MFGMRYPIDVAFLDRGGTVVKIYHGLEPGRRTGWHREARYALEVRAGTLRSCNTCEGDRLVWSSAEVGEVKTVPHSRLGSLGLHSDGLSV
jgi:uncharacterized membrane protein (UPF0127 family)